MGLSFLRSNVFTEGSIEGTRVIRTETSIDYVDSSVTSLIPDGTTNERDYDGHCHRTNEVWDSEKS